MRRLFATLILLAPLVALGADSANDAAAQAHALFDQDWAWRLEHDPEYATGIGDHRYDEKLADASPAGAAARSAHAHEMRTAAQRIDPALLADQDRLSLALFVARQDDTLAIAAIVPFDPQPITSQDGLQIRLPRLVAQMPFVTEDDVRHYLARLHALPGHVDGLIETLRTGVRTGWTAPRAVIAPVPDQLRMLREHLQDGPVGAPLAHLPGTIDAATRERLAHDGADALQDAGAALRKLETFLRTDYLPAARTSIAASSLPGGPAWYALLARQATTTDLAPAAIHALGLKEVARIRVEMQALVPRTGFRGTLPAFIAFARSDQRLFPTSANALLARYRRTLARATQRLPRLFNDAPLDELAVKPAQDADGLGAAYYEAGTTERMAALVVNTSRLDTRPLWEVETLALHEGVPGHHLQITRAQALQGLPAFRRHAWYPAFGEGWALYAEGLGPELELTVDPFSAFGRLADEQLRAARLVIDTGIHALGWSRRQALDFLAANTANPAADNEVEVDRCIAQPGQVLAYAIGQLRILDLRRQAQTQLGERFDVRAFHDAVLRNGALPLDVLDQQVQAWIASAIQVKN